MRQKGNISFLCGGMAAVKDDAFQFTFFSLGFWIMWMHYLVKEIFFLQLCLRILAMQG